MSALPQAHLHHCDYIEIIAAHTHTHTHTHRNQGVSLHIAGIHYNQSTPVCNTWCTPLQRLQRPGAPKGVTSLQARWIPAYPDIFDYHNCEACLNKQFLDNFTMTVLSADSLRCSSIDGFPAPPQEIAIFQRINISWPSQVPYVSWFCVSEAISPTLLSHFWHCKVKTPQIWVSTQNNLSRISKLLTLSSAFKRPFQLNPTEYSHKHVFVQLWENTQTEHQCCCPVQWALSTERPFVLLERN